MTTVAVVPLRDLSGKSRLAGVLDDAARGRLVAALARHVLATLLAEARVGQVLLVMADPAAAAVLGEHPRLRVVAQQAGADLNGAVSYARDLAVERGADRLLVVHADLPALTGTDVAALLDAAGPVALAGDRVGGGTNAVVLAPARRDFVFRFGPGSLAAHRAEATRLGLTARAVTGPGLATDLDTPEDWVALAPGVRARVRRDVTG
ncbi:MAG: 2-phospho-L-lactate guanylyltransferase [Georgenia sp.]